MPDYVYRTRLREWLNTLKKDLQRKVKWAEVVEGTGVAYSTLQKHTQHEYEQPDFLTATKIAAWFSDMNPTRSYSPVDYFVPVEVESEIPEDLGEVVAMQAAQAPA